MSATHTVSLFESVSNGLASLGRALRLAFENYARARAASTLYSELAGLSDDQLADMGLQRDHLSQTVFKRVFDGR